MTLPDLQSLLASLTKGSPTDPIARSPSELGMDSADTGVQTPQAMQSQMQGGQLQPGQNMDDSGGFSLDQSNPFSKLLQIMPGNAGDGSVLGLLKKMSLGSQPGLVPDTGSTNVPNLTPPAQAAVNPTPVAKQRQASLAPVAPQQPAPNQYAQPTALDPNQIEELRMSLLTQSGQLDPNNPNGLAGRMTGPYSESDQGQQRNQAMGIEDSVRGFDGVKSAKIKQQRQNQ